jgi:hypothetical protein
MCIQNGELISRRPKLAMRNPLKAWSNARIAAYEVQVLWLSDAVSNLLIRRESADQLREEISDFISGDIRVLSAEFNEISMFLPSTLIDIFTDSTN